MVGLVHAGRTPRELAREYEWSAQAWFALCAYYDKTDVAAQWKAWRTLLSCPAMTLLPSESEVVRTGEAEGHDDLTKWMQKRYRLEES